MNKIKLLLFMIAELYELFADEHAGAQRCRPGQEAYSPKSSTANCHAFRRPRNVRGRKFLSRRCTNSSRRSRAVWSCQTAW